jgi:hypothetical protein
VVGGYNGEFYTRTDDQRGLNDQKSLQLRATIRPVPRHPIVKGLQLTGFINSDQAFADRKRDRFLGSVTFQHPWGNAGFEYLDAKDQNSAAAGNFDELHRDGFSVWATPRTPIGIEGFFRYDQLNQNKDASPKPRKKRTVFGIAYWPPLQGGKTIALLADYQEVRFSGQTPLPATSRALALHTLWNF